MAVELATAYVNIVPSTGDLAKGITADLAPAATKAGTTAGAGAATGMAAGVAVGLKKFLAPALIAGGVAAAGKGLYGLGAEFDNVADTIRIGTGATGANLQGLIDVAKQVGATVPAEFDKIAPVVADLNTRLGLSGDQLQTVASQYLEAGRMLGQEIDVNATTAAFSAFGITGAKVEGAMDSLFRVSQATGVGMNELAANVKASAPALQELGFTFEDTAALAGGLDKAGLNSSRMMMGLNKALVGVAKAGEDPKEAFKRVTYEIFNLNAEGKKAEALDLAGKLFGTRNAPAFVKALQDGVIGSDDLMASIGAGTDTIMGTAKETMDFAESWQMVQNNAKLALEPLASTVFTALGDALKAAMPYIQSFAKFLSENQWVLGLVATLIGVTLVAAFFAWAASIWASTIALLANPVTWIVIGIIALVAALIWLIANWDSVVKFVTDIWGKFIAWLGTMWDKAVEWVKGIPGRITSALGDLATLLTGSGQKLVDGFLSGIKGAWKGLTDWVSKGMEGLRGLWPFSPAKWGPFSGHGYVTYSGAALTEDFAKSITAGTPAVERAALTMFDSLAAPGINATASVGQVGAATPAKANGLQVVVNNPTPEKASESLSRVYSRAAYLGLDAGLATV